MTGLRRVTTLAVLGALALGSPTRAEAQGATAESTTELAVAAGWIGPQSFGTSDASLTAPNGSPLVIFRAESRLAPGGMLEVHLGQRVARRLWVEATGSWQQGNYETRVFDDIEDGEDLTLPVASSRYTVEGALLWTLVSRDALDVFARGGAGWVRETAGARSLVADGVVGNAGAGMKYWWRQRPGARLQRIGLRVEGRLSLRSGALTLGESKVRFAPVVLGGIIFGF
jgi:hypothetical protein